MIAGVEFNELEIVLGKKLKCFSDGYSSIKYTTKDGIDHEIHKSILVGGYIDFIVDKLGLDLELKIRYHKKYYSYSCEASVSKNSRRFVSGGSKNDMIFTSLEGIIRQGTKVTK